VAREGEGLIFTRWRELAACRGTSLGLWFAAESAGGPPGGDWITADRERVAMAKRICGECPVIRECLQFAMENKCAGIYGGMTEKERKAYAQRH